MKRIPNLPEKKNFKLTFKEQKELVEIDKIESRDVKNNKINRLVYRAMNRPMFYYGTLFKISKTTLLNRCFCNQSYLMDELEDIINEKLSDYVVSYQRENRFFLRRDIATNSHINKKIYVFNNNDHYVICERRKFFPSKSAVSRQVLLFLGIHLPSLDRGEVE